MLFGIGFVALLAAESLEAVAVASKTLAGTLTGMTGHGTSLLVFCGEKSHNSYWV
jgi:hypothetical protein